MKGSEGCLTQAHPVEWLCHLPQEVLGHLDPLIHSQVEVGISKVFLDPAGQLPPLVCPGKPLGRRVGEKGRVSGPWGGGGGGGGPKATLPSSLHLEND